MLCRLSVLGLLLALLPAAAAAQPQEDRDATIARLVATLDDNPDPLHFDVTPAAIELSRLGIHIIPALMDALRAEDRGTRMHAQTAIAFMLRSRLRGDPMLSCPAHIEAGLQRMLTEIWERNGGYRWDAEPAVRARSARLWLAWYRRELVAERRRGSPPPSACEVARAEVERRAASR